MNFWLYQNWNLEFDDRQNRCTINGLTDHILPSDAHLIYRLGAHSTKESFSLIVGTKSPLILSCFLAGIASTENLTNQIVNILGEVNDAEFSHYLDAVSSLPQSDSVTVQRTALSRALHTLSGNSFDFIFIGPNLSWKEFEHCLPLILEKANRDATICGFINASERSRAFELLSKHASLTKGSVFKLSENTSNYWELAPNCSKLISFLLPTKKRPELCIRTIKNCIESSSNPENIEFLCYFDHGDESLSRIRAHFQDESMVKCYSYPAVGYRYLNLFINDLCRKSSARWLCLWNDDALITTRYWDWELLSLGNSFCLLSPLIQNMPDYRGAIFPIIPRNWFKITGCFSNQTHNDTWVEEIAFQLNIFKRSETISVLHERYDETGLNNDTTYQNRTYMTEEFYSPEFTAERRRQAKLISLFLRDKKIDILHS